MRGWVFLLLVGCTSRDEPADVDTHTPVPPVDPWADALAAFPELDPALCAAAPAFEAGGFDPSAPLAADDPLIGKVVPFVALLGTEPLWSDDDRGAVAGGLASALTTARACAGDVGCVRAAVLGGLDAGAPPADLAVPPTAARLRALGTHHDLADLGDAALVNAAWARVVADLGMLFDRYAPASAGSGLGDVLDGVDVVAARSPTDLAGDVVAGLMRADGRDEAGRYEPMEEGVNAGAWSALGELDLGAFPYAAIVVPGQGPSDNDPDTVLTAQGAFRADLGAERWKASVAPVVLVSGGNVHPDRTPYSEAIEMKRYLMEVHGLPEGAVLVDPHARHTTTNVRNASRLLLRAGVSPDKPFLVTTDLAQSGYIAVLVAGRSEEELGYVPWRALTQLGQQDNCVHPTARSLMVDARDPLDP